MSGGSGIPIHVLFPGSYRTMSSGIIGHGGGASGWFRESDGGFGHEVIEEAGFYLGTGRP